MAIELLPDDLAPGDRRSAGLDWSGLALALIDDSRHPLFERCYRRLWDEFGARGEMERLDVIEARLGWGRRSPVADRILLYEMIAIDSDEGLAAVRDHTAIVSSDGEGGAVAVVHLSHVWVDARWRGTGLAAWLRALPIQTARRAAAIGGWGEPGRVTLVAEMEAMQSNDPMSHARLRAYERAGFTKVDTDSVSYLQPDFRSPAQIDATELQPVPLSLIVRRVGLEYETHISGGEVVAIVSALYSMFAVHTEPRHMQPLWDGLRAYPARDVPVRLLSPTR